MVAFTAAVHHDDHLIPCCTHALNFVLLYKGKWGEKKENASQTVAESETCFKVTTNTRTIILTMWEALFSPKNQHNSMNIYLYIFR